MSKRLAPAAILLFAGFLLGGLTGWSQRPAEWQAGLWQTAHASVNAATYGHAYESQAERVLLYFMYGGILGTVVVGVLIAGLTVATNRRRGGGCQPHDSHEARDDAGKPLQPMSRRG